MQYVLTIFTNIFSCFSALVHFSCGRKENQNPNFIIIYCDDLDYRDIGPYSNKVHRTPSLDLMASEGVVCALLASRKIQWRD